MGNAGSQVRLYDTSLDKQWSSEVYHKAQELWLQLLSNKPGSAVKSSEVRQRMKAQYPSLCNDDIRDRNHSQAPYWHHLVATALSSLKLSGKARKVADGWVAEPLVQRPSAGARQIQAQVVSPPSTSWHEQLKTAMVEIGTQLGYYTKTENGPVYRHDVSWHDNEYATTPSYVIEVCEGGSLPKDFDALHWASDKWRAKGILVVTDDKDFEKARKRFAGQPNVAVVKAETVEHLHKVAQDNPEFLRFVFGK